MCDQDFKKNSNPLVVGITMGDFNGIGPEIAINAATKFCEQNSVRVILIGSRDIFDSVCNSLPHQKNYVNVSNINEIERSSDKIFLLDIFENQRFEIQYGRISRQAGLAAGQCIKKGVDLLLQRKICCLTTAPVSKEALFLAGYKFPGQTEMLASLTKSKRFLMMLVAGDFRVALVTTHCSISKIAAQLSTEKILEKIKILHQSLKKEFGITEPKIGISALNPHASDGGNFGDEEKRLIVPAIKKAQSIGIFARGPFPADTLFAQTDQLKFDSYLVMYHDQGLIPLKMKSFGRGVNFTAGLPIVRTSPDHGTAFDIAGKFNANYDSMLEAIKFGCAIAEKKHC